MNNFFKICFVIFPVLYGMQNDKNQGWYKKFLDDRNVGIPTSAIVGGTVGAGLRYLLHKNKFLSSFRAAEKIKHAPYFKFVGAGAIVTVGLYELLKRLKKPKQSDKGKSKALSESKNKKLNRTNEENEEKKEDNSKNKEEKIDYNKAIKVVYVCPGTLYSLFNSGNGLKTDTANQIEEILNKGEIKKYNSNQFWFCSREQKFLTFSVNTLRNCEYAAALYLVHEDQKEAFGNMFKESSEKKSLLCNLYTIDKPKSKENLWCYALPFAYYECFEGKKTYSIEIDSKITKDNIDSYSFQLTEKDAKKINLNETEICGIEFNVRANNGSSYDY